MKHILVLSLLSLVAFSACKNTEKRDAATDIPDPAAAPVVYVSNYPLYYFAKRIGGDHIELHFPASDMADPSGWTPPADTVAAMQQADLILLNGATYEGWLMNVSLPDSLLVDTSGGFSIRLLPSGETFTHSHGEEGEHAHEGTAFTTWLDLSLASRQAMAVKNALVRSQPAWRNTYESNYLGLEAELQGLDDEFRKVAESAADAHLVFSHPVYQYFQKAYGLEGSSLHWEPETPLDHDKLHELGHLKKDHHIPFMIWEGDPLPESVTRLEEMGIRYVVIDPMGGMPESGDFISGMEQNLTALQRALEVQP